MNLAKHLDPHVGGASRNNRFGLFTCWVDLLCMELPQATTTGRTMKESATSDDMMDMNKNTHTPSRFGGKKERMY
jgi:hypothetical protein|tara:strand:- start:1 stop:225 length:225 start_codon:yes stop_codon:yes gene_type:complete